MDDEFAITLNVNGHNHALSVPPTRVLLAVLREELNLTGVKCGCNQGICGSCTVLIDGLPVRSCLSLAVNSTEREIITIEGLTKGAKPSLVQRAFLETGAIQCGFCMPGFILTATAFIAENSSPTADDVRHAISGNLCRCSGYVKVVDAISLATQMAKADGATS